MIVASSYSQIGASAPEICTETTQELICTYAVTAYRRPSAGAFRAPVGAGSEEVLKAWAPPLLFLHWNKRRIRGVRVTTSHRGQALNGAFTPHRGAFPFCWASPSLTRA